MAALDRLLAPYRSAVAGTPTTEASISADPLMSLLLPQITGGGGGAGGASADGLDPLLQKLQARLPWLDLTSSFRSHEDQQRLWKEALAKYGDPEIADNWVARPGTSEHEEGNAIDVAKEDINRLVQWLGNHPKYGSQIYRPMEWEPWHFQV